MIGPEVPALLSGPTFLLFVVALAVGPLVAYSWPELRVWWERREQRRLDREWRAWVSELLRRRETVVTPLGPNQRPRRVVCPHDPSPTRRSRNR